MAEHNRLGRAGELAACRHLEKLGYRILARNYTYAGYEADIIARDRRDLVIVEVKSRSTETGKEALSIIDREKMAHIIAVGRAYNREYGLRLPIRYDAIAALYRPEQGVFEIKHYKDFFREQDIQPIAGTQILP